MGGFRHSRKREANSSPPCLLYFDRLAIAEDKMNKTIIAGTLTLTLSALSACTPAEQNDAGPSADVALSADVEQSGDVIVSAPDAADGIDAGNTADAGIPTCPEFVAPLGTLELNEAYEVTDSREFVIANALAMRGERILAMDFIGEVSDHGTFLVPEDNPTSLGNILPDDSEGVFASPYLVNAGNTALGGYTGAFDPESGFFSGGISLLATAPGSLDAPGNFDAAAFSDEVVLVNGSGIEGVNAPGVVGYNLTTDTAFEVSSFDATWSASNGYIAVTNTGFGIFGGFYSPDESPATNRLRVATPAQLNAAVNLNTPVAMNSLDEIAAYGMLDVAAIGDEVAILKGDFGAPAFGIVTHELSLDGDTLSVGEEETLLRVANPCTSIGNITSDGDNLLVTVVGDDATYLVRIARR